MIPLAVKATHKPQTGILIAMAKNKQYLIHPFFKFVALLVRPRVIVQSAGPILKRPVLIIANHVSHWDGIIVIAQFTTTEIRAITPIHTITANRFLFGHPLGWILRKLGCFPARPHANQPHGLQAARDIASQGSSLLFFPQGGIVGKQGRKKPYSGAAVIANETGIPVLPLFIDVNKGKFKVVRGKQFSAEGMDIEAMMEKVWELRKHTV